jgi:hypothetical protein
MIRRKDSMAVLIVGNLGDFNAVPAQRVEDNAFHLGVLILRERRRQPRDVQYG